jgi:glyoxylase-like metal-dependent hydrolase (beta-lactamase superfamily II)
MEVAPGIHRIESDLGPRFMCQFLLRGEERAVLVDTGLRATPEEALVPYLEGIGCPPEQLDLVVITHADVDHCGGNRALRARAPRASFACHELDRRWIESNRAMLAENYSWYEAYGFGLPEDMKQWILAELGGDSPIDIGLRGGETLRLGPGWRVELVHLPGHTPGHLGIWDPRSRTALIVDAVLERGIYDRAGTLLIPPRYYDAQAYRATIERVRSLQPELLLTAHFPVMDRAEAAAFLDRSLAFVDELETAVRDAVAEGVADLWELTRRAAEQVGPYPEPIAELAASVRAQLAAA